MPSMDSWKVPCTAAWTNVFATRKGTHTQAKPALPSRDRCCWRPGRNNPCAQLDRSEDGLEGAGAEPAMRVPHFVVSLPGHTKQDPCLRDLGVAGAPAAARVAPRGLWFVAGARFGAGGVSTWTGQTTKPPAKRTLAGRETGHHRRRGLAHSGRAEKRGGRHWWERGAEAGAEPAVWQQSCDALPTVISNLQSQARGAHPFRCATLRRSKTGIRSTRVILQGDGTEAPDEMQINNAPATAIRPNVTDRIWGAPTRSTTRPSI